MITLESVSYAYPRTGRDAISDITLSLKRGECVLVSGRSGSGKTTLCLAAAGILEHEYGGRKSGSVAVNGKDVGDYRDLSDLSTSVGILFDDPDSQLIFTTVEEEILSALERRGFSPEEVEERLSRVLAVTGLEGLKDRPPHALSGGQKQRVVLATTLALGTDILILDEPTSELDEKGTDSIVSLLKELKAQGKAILLVEQKYPRLAAVVDRYVILEDGKIRTEGTADHVLSDETAKKTLIPDFSGIRGENVTDRGRPPIIRTEGLSFRYGDDEALSGIDLEIAPGEFVAIVGENGSGKTTLIKHFIGLLRPEKGTVRVDGKDAAKAPVAELAHSVGLVFQNPDHMFFADSVFDEVAFGVDNLKIPDRERAVIDALSTVRLEHLRDLYPRWLSRGERQRLAIGCILAMKPPVLILDEPTTGLDGEESREIIELIKRLQGDGHTIIMVTHSREIAEECADRIVRMDAGKIVSDSAAGA
ncbi:MAG TPA: energy-coupling factor transporter ATPase [Methanoregulaceae archaeon]|jgi:energy-coupling factor transport system ATP-binding protein|nr:energy-coupling factor ABC transporter ATP-binding protein [Methanolinea sp.]MCC7567533.1 ATP-binding cassette domain-containing protein [Methanoregulaceae archaeon]MDD3090166.1 energy-coupling factor transporter ATPase [Methanoregulaceae archaeon]MDD5048204.1 energy-coupling factor transporter ATPase [Methanoregulaceae archaeon]MDD5684466.1 energy-coupling factor transporter ATPase [Methanoregulaceae archaeon]